MRFRTKIFEQEFLPIANSVSLRPYTKSKPHCVFDLCSLKFCSKICAMSV